MVSTRRRGQVFGLSTTQLVSLQARRDMVASRISKKWTRRQKSALQSRGIRDAGWRCYQNAVLQAFVHQPQTLNCLASHDSRTCDDNNCVGCNLKGLSQAHWSSANAAPLPANNEWLVRIDAAAVASSLFEPGRYEDGDEFYQWMLRALQAISPSIDHAEQYRALFVMSFRNEYVCSICDQRTPMLSDEEHGLNLQLGTTIDSVGKAIAAFMDDARDANCHNCGGTTTGNLVKTIEAAPTTLRLSLSIFEYDLYRGQHRITRRIDVPKQLDLAQCHTEPKKRLTYSLSSMIKHAGSGEPIDTKGMRVDGHYMATAQGPNSVATIDDESVRQRQSLNENPDGSFNAYVLTYIRDTLPGIPKILKELL